MKSEKKILFAFVLNLAFSVFECIGGILTGSVAILSDAVHDLTDAVGIGSSWLLERKSKGQPDEKYTYGYVRYSVLGSLLITVLLLVGSITVIVHAVGRIFEPVSIHYDGMILFAVVGVCVNGAAAYFTHGGDSLNQRAVSLHMLEDVLGWILVLIGAVIMRFTDIAVLDPILSICVALYIFVHAIGHLREALSILLEKTPDEVDLHEILHCVGEIEGISDVHHVHVWTLDGHKNCATMHIVATKSDEIRAKVRGVLHEHGICHVTIEVESEACVERHCQIGSATAHHHHHH